MDRRRHSILGLVVGWGCGRPGGPVGGTATLGPCKRRERQALGSRCAAHGGRVFPTPDFSHAPAKTCT